MAYKWRVTKHLLYELGSSKWLTLVISIGDLLGLNLAPPRMPVVNKRFQGIPEMSKCNNFLANDIGRVSYLRDFVPTSRYGEIYIYICFVVFGYFLETT